MTDIAASFVPPPGLRNGHIQSLIASSGLRRMLVVRRSAAVRAVARDWILNAGGDTRLHGLYSPQPESAPETERRGLAVLFHGWEGGAGSNYILSNSARLYADGFDVFRLNFRDHGNTHHLNPGIFHSCRLDEVVAALTDLQRRLKPGPWSLAGYSLGGNFALRVGLRAPEAGLEVKQIVAVCPVISAANSMLAMEQGSRFYERYFMRKWGRSLKIKKQMYSEIYGDDAFVGIKRLRDRTDYLAREYAGFDSADAYFDGYSIHAGRLAPLSVPATILTSEDDPVIPIADFRDIPANPNIEVVVSKYGGHCGFLKNYRLGSLAEDLVAEKFLASSVL